MTKFGPSTPGPPTNVCKVVINIINAIRNDASMLWTCFDLLSHAQRCFLNSPRLQDLSCRSQANNLRPQITPITGTRAPWPSLRVYHGTGFTAHPHSVPRYFCIHLLACSLSSIQFGCTLFRQNLSLRQYRSVRPFDGLRHFCCFVSPDSLIRFPGLD